MDPVADEAGRYCYVPTTHKATLGEIVDLLEAFKNQPKTLLIPEIPEDSFAKKLYSTYLSYLPKEEVSFPLKMNVDDRGSFTELLKTANCGQFSVNISKPGITKGEHWHNSKSHCRSRSRNSCIAACDHKYRLSDPIGLYYQLWFDCRPWMCDRRRRTYFSGDCDQGRKSDSKSNKN